MAEMYDVKKSYTISNEILEKAVTEQRPRGQAGYVAKEDGLKFDKVTQLHLDLRNISVIDDLWQFTSLTKLHLNNNLITKIQGLEKLTKLVRLDLSFNNIEVIEGLDTLVKLEDLSLFSNRISVIENMDALQNLQIISLGNNSISLIENVLCLRNLKKLRALQLAGNPVSKKENYKVFVAAFLSDLVYLDYRQLDEQTRKKAQDQYKIKVREITQKELEEQQAAEAQKKVEEELQLHKAAFVEYLNGPHLFNSMFEDDVEASKLAHLPEFAKLLESYQKQFEPLCTQIFKEGLSHRTKRQNKVEDFFTAFQKVQTDQQQRGAQIVADFERSRRQLMAEMQQPADHSLSKGSFRNEILQHRDTLLTWEMKLLGLLFDISHEFEKNITDMTGEFVRYAQGLFAQCRNLENNHYEQVLQIAVATVDKVANKELQLKIPADLHMLFVDKNMMISAVDMSKDIHLLKINNREDNLLARINDWKSALIKSIQNDISESSHIRISEILTYIEYAMDQLDTIA